MAYFAFEGIRPIVDESALVHPDATIIGDVEIGKNVFIGAQAVLRGDFGKIIVEDGANIQETCVIHCFPQKIATIATHAHIGHGAIIHGAQIGKNVLIGMNAVIMDDATIGENAIIGALSFVKEGAQIGAGKLAFGNPVREIRDLTPEEIEWKANGTMLYQDLAAARATTACAPARPGETMKVARSNTYSHLPKSELKFHAKDQR